MPLGKSEAAEEQMIIDTWSGGHWFCQWRTFQTLVMIDWIITVLSVTFTYAVQSKPCAWFVNSPNPTDSRDVKTPFGWFVTRLDASISHGKWLHMYKKHSDAAVNGLKWHVHDETTVFTLKTMSDLRSRLASTLLSRFSMLALSREHFSIGIKPIKKLKTNQCQLLNREGKNEHPSNSKLILEQPCNITRHVS